MTIYMLLYLLINLSFKIAYGQVKRTDAFDDRVHKIGLAGVLQSDKDMLSVKQIYKDICQENIDIVIISNDEDLLRFVSPVLNQEVNVSSVTDFYEAGKIRQSFYFFFVLVNDQDAVFFAKGLSQGISDSAGTDDDCVNIVHSNSPSILKI